VKSSFGRGSVRALTGRRALSPDFRGFLIEPTFAAQGALRGSEIRGQKGRAAPPVPERSETGF